MENLQISLVIFDIVVLVIAGVLIPIGIKIINCLNNISTTIKSVNTATDALVASLKEISERLTDAHIRDKDIESRLKSIEMSLARK